MMTAYCEGRVRMAAEPGLRRNENSPPPFAGMRCVYRMPTGRPAVTRAKICTRAIIIIKYAHAHTLAVCNEDTEVIQHTLRTANTHKLAHTHTPSAAHRPLTP